MHIVNTKQPTKWLSICICCNKEKKRCHNKMSSHDHQQSSSRSWCQSASQNWSSLV